MEPFGSLSEAISWLDKQGGFTQGVALALVAAGGAAVVSGMKWVWGAMRDRRTEQSTTDRALDAALQADFERGPSELGTVDHGVNMTASLEGSMAVLRRIVPSVQHLMDTLVGALARFPEDGADDYVARKQAVHRETAKMIHPDVMDLEAAATELGPLARQTVEAFRVVLRIPLKSPKDRTTLESLSATYRGGVAESFAKVADVCRQKRAQLVGFEGHEQSLSRMVRRSLQAFDSIEASAIVVSTFCGVELPRSISERLAEQARANVGPSSPK